MAKATTNTAVAKTNGDQLPDFLAKGKTVRVGNLDSSDLILPRVKLMQKISPEIDAFPGVAVHRQFFHNIMNVSLGDQLRAIPIIIRKSYVLWAPRNDERGILARASDGVHWDPGFENREFTIRPKGSPHDVTYKTGANVKASGLAEFGSGIPGDPNSPPAAALTYNIMFYFPDFPDLSPAVIINTRSSAKRGKDLNTKIDLRPVDHYGQVYTIGVSDEKNDAGEAYYNYTYTAAGYVQDEDLFNHTKAMFERFNEVNWQANDEGDDVETARSEGDGSATSDKF